MSKNKPKKKKEEDIKWGAVIGFISIVVFSFLCYITYTARFPALNRFYDNFLLGDPQGKLIIAIYSIFVVLFFLVIFAGALLLIIYLSTETFRAIWIGIQKLQDKSKNEKNQKTDKESSSSKINK